MNLILLERSELCQQHADGAANGNGDVVDHFVIADHGTVIGSSSLSLKEIDADDGTGGMRMSADGVAAATTTISRPRSYDPVIRNGNSNTVRLTGKDPRAKHIVNHLKKERGDTVMVGILNGPKQLAQILHIGGSNNHDNGSVTLRLDFLDMDGTTTTSRSPITSPSMNITLVLAMPFPMRLKYLWPVVAGMGVVSRIVIVRGHLSNIEHTRSRSVQEPAFYEPLLREGLSQGGHTRMPRVDIDVGDVVSKTVLERLNLHGSGGSMGDGTTTPSLLCDHDPSSYVAKIFLDCGDETKIPPPVRNVVLQQMNQQRWHKQQPKPSPPTTERCLETDDAGYKDSSPVDPKALIPTVATTPASSSVVSAVIAVGPERGWTDTEAALFADAGFQSALLGPSILRVDTAVVAGIAATLSALQEVVATLSSSSTSSLSSSETSTTRKRRRTQEEGQEA